MLRIAASGVDYEDTFVNPGVGLLRTPPSALLIDVTIGRFSDNSILALQVLKRILYSYNTL